VRAPPTNPPRFLSPGAFKLLNAEVSKVSKTQYSTVKILGAEFAAASKDGGKNLCGLPERDVTLIDANEKEHTSRQYTIFCFGDEIYDDMPLLN